MTSHFIPPKLPPNPRLSSYSQGYSKGFTDRNNAALVRNGQGNASDTTRVAEDFFMVGEDGTGDNDGDNDDDGKSIKSTMSMASHAPSLHPSLANSTFSMACSEDTIGAGDNTSYWDFQHRQCTRSDLGHQCRECKQPFSSLKEAITERRGARTSMRYHAECFSGFADPRSQASSSMHTGRLANTQFSAAPASKAGTKMRTSKHFESGGSIRASIRGAGGGGKIAAMMGNNSFGSKSSKGVISTGIDTGGANVNGGLSTAQLEAHTKLMALQEEKDGGGDNDNDNDNCDDVYSI